MTVMNNGLGGEGAYIISTRWNYMRIEVQNWIVISINNINIKYNIFIIHLKTNTVIRITYHYTFLFNDNTSTSTRTSNQLIEQRMNNDCESIISNLRIIQWFTINNYQSINLLKMLSKHYYWMYTIYDWYGTIARGTQFSSKRRSKIGIWFWNLISKHTVLQSKMKSYSYNIIKSYWEIN